MKSRVIVVGVVEKDGNILLGKKPPNIGPYPNTWHIPGGGVNLEEESLEEALRREIKEETGVEVENIEAVGFDEDNEPNKHGEITHYIFLDYKAKYKSGEVKAGDDMNSVKWIPANKIGTLNLNRVSRRLLTKMKILS